MAARFLVVPQWQGSASSRAMRLIDGANAILGDLPSSVTDVIEVPVEAGDAGGTGVQRYSALVTVAERMAEELQVIDGPVITIGGDCGCDLAAVQHAARERTPGSLALVWFDAHPDLHVPQTSRSGAFCGMVLRALIGEGADRLASRGDDRIDEKLVVLAGVRSYDDAESEYVQAHNIRRVEPNDIADADAMVQAVAATGADSVYIHVDLDVLDPSTIDGADAPEPFGVQPADLCDTIRALRARFALAGASVLEFAPESPDAASADLPVILRILGALTRPLEAAGPSA